MCHHSVPFTLLAGDAGASRGPSDQQTEALDPVTPVQERGTPTQTHGQKSDDVADTCALRPVLNYVPGLTALAQVPEDLLE